MELTDSENLEGTIEHTLEVQESQNRQEDYMYSLIDTKLDKMYQAARNGAVKEVDDYQEELRQLYQNIETLDLDRII